MSDTSKRSGSRGAKLSRRKFLLGSAATVAGTAITVNSERANAFFNTFGFMKKSAGNGQTSNGYVIGQSLRFNGSVDANLSRTFGSTNRNLWTFSCWYKRAKTGNTIYNLDVIFSPTDGGTVGNREQLNVSNDAISYIAANTTYQVVSSQLLRDPAAFYHLVWAVDLTQTTAANRVQMYVNGVQVQAFSAASYPPQNWAGAMTNTSIAHYIGVAPYNPTGNGRAADGVISEINFIDGQALTPNSFGQTDTNSGQWIPKAYSGAYGINGFYLNFADNSNTTAATLGKDSSPNGNNWAPNSLQTYDQVLDSPTNNFATLNPLKWQSAGNTVSNGNLTQTEVSAAATWQCVHQTQYVTSGKWYAEFTTDIVSGGSSGVGVADVSAGIINNTYPAESTSNKGWMFSYFNGGNSKRNDGSITSFGSIPSNGNVIMCSVDMDNGNIWWGLNGTWFAGGAPSSGTAPAYSNLAGYTVCFFTGISAGGAKITTNFGQGGQTGLTYDAASGGRFKYTPPAGFKALCTVNLPSNMPVVTSGTFTGNANADGPFVWLGGAPTDLTINGNAVTWGTHADKLANGFKVRTSSASYNASGSNSFSATVPARFKWATARSNP